MDLLRILPRQFQRGEVLLKREVDELDVLTPHRQNPAVRFLHLQAAQCVFHGQFRPQQLRSLARFEPTHTTAGPRLHAQRQQPQVFQPVLPVRVQGMLSGFGHPADNRLVQLQPVIRQLPAIEVDHRQRGQH